MLNKLREEVNRCEITTHFWLTNESCNKLIEEAEKVRLTEEGILELNFSNGEIVGLKIGAILLYGDSKTAYARVMYLNGYKIDASARNCKIL